MKTKLCKPILVEIKDKTSSIWSYKGRKLYYNQANFNDPDETRYYELILISLDPEEKIEVGDTYYDEFPTTPFGISDSYDFIKKCKYPKALDEGCYKVIATQSQLPLQYIQQFIEQYNKGEVEDIEIEMNSVLIAESSDKYENNDIIVNGTLVDSIHHELEEEIQKAIKKHNIPKLNDENQVQIVEKKPILYTEEEVLAFCKKSYNLRTIDKEVRDTKSFENWYEQNKKIIIKV